MNSLIETLNRLGTEVLPVAWQMLWQSSLLITAVGLLNFSLRRKVRASVRYALWLIVLVKLVVPPTLASPTGLAWWLRPSEAPPQQITVQPRNIVVTYSEVPVPMFAPIAQEEFVPPPLRLSTEGWMFIVAVVVSVALLAWLSFRWIQVSRIVRRATAPADSLRQLLDEACRIFAINTRVRLRITKEKMSPAVCGLFRPVILLPATLAENLPTNQQRAVLIHELIHLKRCDVWINCAQALLQIVYWWHPLLWFANARIRRVREEAVDDAVMLALREDANTYAPTLLEVAKLAFHRPLASLGLVGILESRSALRQRVERLIDFKSPRRAGLSLVSILGIAAFTAVAVPMEKAPPRSVKQKSSAPSGLVQKDVSRNLISDSREILADPQFKPALEFLQGRTDANKWADTVQFIQLAQNSIAPSTQPSLTSAQISPLDGVLAFDKELKEATVNAGEAEAKFKFNLTNVSSSDITITNISTSCGCTVAKMPASPWVLAPGATGEIPVTMNVAGKSGELTKTITVNSDKGTKTLIVKATIMAASPIQLAENSVPATTPRSPLDGVLAFEKELKEATVNARILAFNNDFEVKFKFDFTNVSSFDVTISNITTSCGCTVAKMPMSPWLLEPGAHGEIPVTMNVAGKTGELTKTVTVISDRGAKTLTVKATILGAVPNSADVPNLIHTSPGRKAFMEKLDRIHLEQLSFSSEPLSKVIRVLSEQAKRLDPEGGGINFFINPGVGQAAGVNPATGLPIIDPSTGLPTTSTPASNDTDIRTTFVTVNPPLTNARLADALEAIVKGANQPIKYSILDYAIVFSPKGTNEAPPLMSRRYRVDPNTFILALEKATGIELATTGVGSGGNNGGGSSGGNGLIPKSNFVSRVQTALIAFFKSAGANIEPPKSLYFNDREGSLWIRATAQDLDIIEQVIQTANAAPPQVNIRVQFIEMPTEMVDPRWASVSLKNNTNGITGILTIPATRELLNRLKSSADANVISEGNVTTLSGRYAQIQMVEKKDFVTRDSQTGLLRTNTVPCGPVLDVIPTVSADGYTIQMDVTPTFTEFLGYDQSTTPRPRIRMRQTTGTAIVWDGQTLVFGQFAPKEIVLNNNSPTETSTTEDPKRNLLVLVTPTIIDPAGNRIHADEDMPLVQPANSPQSPTIKR
jgi:beta-lactamase regulating signal transducer with metallopeptidase domain